ncbi:proteasome subunit beta [Candidatus Woesearchaeota archaeon]|jgi:proteasome beta subunit|nr:proteasome subunit beta [Candidatus Woesearchaeota archaeon]MBT7062854.1 proteasome subunit beta [Candidatus Woesearchaeota archaeon]MBT7403019.1 proteasome subunit beta [Candidatus Woesearchaeota archaeon]
MAQEQHKKGTTTVGVICKDGVILAADQLASLGDFQFNKDARKIYQIAENIAMTTAGTVGDNQAIIRIIEAQMKLYELDIGQPSVKAAITLLSNMLSDKYLYTYLPYGLFNLVGGFDTEPRLYSIDPVGGIGEEKNFAATGSGMVVAYGILDSDFKSGISTDEGIKLAVKSIVAARKRVSSVGGENITVMKITAKGVEELAPIKVQAIAKTY